MSLDLLTSTCSLLAAGLLGLNTITKYSPAIPTKQDVSSCFESTGTRHRTQVGTILLVEV